MDQITRFAIDNSRLTILVLVAITIVGIQTFLTMPSQEDPEIKIRNAQVTVHYPGLSTKLMEDLIARKLEKKIKQIPEVEEVKTTIKTGYVLVSPKVHDRYFDLEPIWQDLRNKMNDIKSELPQDAIGPIVNDDYGRVAAATIALYGRGFDLREIRDVASNLQDEIALMDSVSKVEVFGSQDEYIYISINPIRLSYYSLSVNELAKALKEQNIVLPGGTIDAGGSDIAIEPSGNFQSVEDIRNVQIKVKDTEQTVYLRDIAEIRRAYIDPPQYPSYFNNRPSIILSVSMIPNYNIEDFGEQISTKVAGAAADLADRVANGICNLPACFGQKGGERGGQQPLSNDRGGARGGDYIFRRAHRAHRRRDCPADDLDVSDRNEFLGCGAAAHVHRRHHHCAGAFGR